MKLAAILSERPRSARPKVEPPAEGAEGARIDLRSGALSGFDSALEGQAVTLGHLLEAQRMSQRRWNHDEAKRQTYARYLPKLLRSFERTYGAIEELYLSKNISAGAVLTDRKGELSIHLRYPPEVVAGVTPDFEETLWRCSALARKSKQLLRTQNSRMLLKLLHSLIVYLLSVLDSLAKVAPGPDRDGRIEQALATAERELDEAHAQYLMSAIWGAQLAYFRGMLAGIVILGVVLGAAAVLGEQIDPADLNRFLVTLSAGGLGAVVSVMTRLTSNRLRLRYQAEHSALLMLGVFRPLIGALFGAALYVLISGDLLNISVPADGNEAKVLYFLAGLAFLAGFSERFAQDAVTGASQAAAGAAPGAWGEPGRGVEVGPDRSAGRRNQGAGAEKARSDPMPFEAHEPTYS